MASLRGWDGTRRRPRRSSSLSRSTSDYEKRFCWGAHYHFLMYTSDTYWLLKCKLYSQLVKTSLPKQPYCLYSICHNKPSCRWGHREAGKYRGGSRSGWPHRCGRLCRVGIFSSRPMPHPRGSPRGAHLALPKEWCKKVGWAHRENKGEGGEGNDS